LRGSDRRIMRSRPQKARKRKREKKKSTNSIYFIKVEL
jgi:hypothetical protein